MSDQVPQQFNGTPTVVGTFNNVRLQSTSGNSPIIGQTPQLDNTITVQVLTAAGVLTNAAAFDTNDTVNETRMFIARGGGIGLVRVTIGAADSGGAGFRLLRIPN